MRDPERQELVRQLNGLGIRGAEVYLLDVIPLLEMLWADGRAQNVEKSLVDQFLDDHVKNVNAMAGYALLTREAADTFVARYLNDRPSAELLAKLREIVPAVRFGNSNPANRQHQDELLDWCLDIASACVADYPYDDRERFCEQEKESFRRILGALSKPA